MVMVEGGGEREEGGVKRGASRRFDVLAKRWSG